MRRIDSIFNRTILNGSNSSLNDCGGLKAAATYSNGYGGFESSIADWSSPPQSFNEIDHFRMVLFENRIDRVVLKIWSRRRIEKSRRQNTYTSAYIS